MAPGRQARSYANKCTFVIQIKEDTALSGNLKYTCRGELRQRSMIYTPITKPSKTVKEEMSK